MIWISAVWALDPLYDCPTVTVPADALVYRSTESVDTLIQDVLALAAPYLSAECDWVETTDGTTTTRVCEGPDYYVERVSTEYSDGVDTWSSGYDTYVSAPEPWLELDYHHGWWGTSIHGGTSESWLSVSWTGSIDGLPDGGELAVASEIHGQSYDDPANYAEHTSVTTPECSWTYGDVADSWLQETYAYAEGGGHTVTVYETGGWWTCLEEEAYAELDDVRVGNVDPVTWELYPDADGDTYGGASDCDDTRADVNVCANEVDDDGIDQDCDGTDSFDTDGDLDDDGSDGALAGGADCDDDDRAVHPGADDPAGDGVDTDCDGADDVDADNDGFTADGDNRQADCDDADPLIFPGADEIAQDGIDQDCRGGDDLDADQDGFDTPRDCDDNNPGISPTSWDWACDGIDQDCNGEDPCTLTVTPEPERGCGAAAWVFLVPLLGFGASRRSRRG